jgi:hypothetical protein
MMMRQSRSKGFVTFDALFSIIPILLLISITMQASADLSKRAQYHSHRQQVFDKLVSVADYTVKIGAARHYGNLRYPNWIDESRISEGYEKDMLEKAGLSALYIGIDEPEDDYAVCLYRIVVVGPEKEIRKLFVCGG